MLTQEKGNFRKASDSQILKNEVFYLENMCLTVENISLHFVNIMLLILLIDRFEIYTVQYKYLSHIFS